MFAALLASDNQCYPVILTHLVNTFSINSIIMDRKFFLTQFVNHMAAMDAILEEFIECSTMGEKKVSTFIESKH